MTSRATKRAMATAGGGNTARFAVHGAMGRWERAR